MVKLISFVLMNGLVFTGAILVARFGLRFRDYAGTLLGGMLLGWVSIVLGLEGLSFVRLICIDSAFGLAALIFGLGIASWWWDRRYRSDKTLAVLNSDRDLAHVTRSTDRGASSPRPVASSDTTGTSSGSGMARFAAFLGCILAAWAALDVLTSSLANPVQVVSDAPIYHLYLATRWWQAGAIEIVPTPFGESAAPYFPANGDVWFTWLLLPWSSEAAAKVGQWPFLIVGMCGLTALVREMGVRCEIAVFPAVLWGTISLTLVQASFADVDLIVAAWYIVAVVFLVRFSRESRAADLACSALAMGAALGTKYVSIPFLAWLVAAAIALVWKRPRRALSLAILFGGMLIPSIYWYGRNLLLTGNPLYPLHVQFLGQTIVAGWYTRATMLENVEYHIPVLPLVQQLRVLLQIILRGLDPALLPLWLSGIAAAVVAIWRGRRLAGALVFLAVLHIVCFWFVIPYQREERFLLPAFALLAVPVGLVLDRWPITAFAAAALISWHLVVDQVDLGISRFPPPVPAPLGLPVSSSGTILEHPITSGRLVLLGAIILAAVLCALAWRGTVARRAAVAATALAIVVTGMGFRARWAVPPMGGDKLRFYPLWIEGGYLSGWHRLEDQSGRGARVAYAGTNLPFFLCGIGLRNQVRYVNVNDHADFCMHDYHFWYTARGEPLSATATPDWDRREVDESAWLRNLRTSQIDLLFVGLVNRAGGVHNFYDRDGFPIERTWADRHPDLFHLVYADRWTRVYVVKIGAT